MRRKFSVLFCTLAMASIALLAAVGSVAAKQHYPYTLIDLGTLGGPQAGVSNPPLIEQGAGALGHGGRGAHHGAGRPHGSLNGVVFGVADTATLDPYANQNGYLAGDGHVQHAFLWRNGTLTDLGALGPDPVTNSSSYGGANTQGDAVGFSNNGLLDPGLGGTAEIRGVLWKNGQLTDLGTFGGDESVAYWINNRDQATGSAANTVPDQYSILGWATQTRAFIWQKGVMTDLGTLGGPDAQGVFINDGGQVAGNSSPNGTVIPAIGGPAQHPFLWANGQMQDLGTLGGNFANVSNIWPLNARGQVVGYSTLAGDTSNHAFLWDGHHLLDLGTLGGTNSNADSVNDGGAVVGSADLPNGNHDGFLWQNGHMQDLPPVSGAPCANAIALNRKNAVVGDVTDCHGTELDAVLWKDGAASNLNDLVAPDLAPHDLPFPDRRPGPHRRPRCHARRQRPQLCAGP